MLYHCYLKWGDRVLRGAGIDVTLLQTAHPARRRWGGLGYEKCHCEKEENALKRPAECVVLASE